MPTVTILVDNTVATSRPKGLRGEWGFAAALDGILFDTGQSDSVVQNARRLGVPTSFEAIVLSHAHYDHTTGLPHVLEHADTPTLYAHPDIWTGRYATESSGGERSAPEHIGIPYSKARIQSSVNLVEHQDPREIAPDVYALGEIPRPHPETTVGKRAVDGELVADPVVDDQALAVRTDGGTALVLGCCHAGLRNSIEHAESVTGDVVRYVVGGTHLVAMDDDAIHELADRLEGTLELFAGTHCTGFEAQAILTERLPDAFRHVGVGSTIDLPPT